MEDTIKILGPQVGYIDLLDAATKAKIEKEDKEGGGFQKTPIRPSSAGNCSRELYYQLMEFHKRAKYEKELINPETHRLFALGHSVEYSLLRQFELLSKVFELKYKQQVLSFKYLEAKNDPKLSQWLEGSLDVVLWSDKYKCVADVKSKKDGFFGPFKTRWQESSEHLHKMKSVKSISEHSFWVEDLPAFLIELDDPFFAANFMQVNLYANAEFLIERGVNHGAIIQYNKNTSQLKEVRFKPSRALYEQTVAKMGNVIQAVDTDNIKLAPQDHPLGSMKCAYCKYASTCRPGEDVKDAFKAANRAKRELTAPTKAVKAKLGVKK